MPLKGINLMRKIINSFINSIRNLLFKHKILIASFLLAVILKMFFFDIIIVNGDSMNPTFYNHDIMIIDKFSYLISKPNNSDIVIVKDMNNFTIVKRIVARENDIIKFKNRAMYVNSVKLLDDSLVEENKLIKIVKDYYYLIGDNNRFSIDSRKFGAVHKSVIKGKEILVIPTSKIF